MSKLLPLVLQLQRDAVDEKKSVSGLLRTAKVIATKLDQKDALVWIDRELEGYNSGDGSELPHYRQLKGRLKALNPYHGWQPVIFETPENEDICSQAPIGQSLGSIEEGFDINKKDSPFLYVHSANNRAVIIKALQYETDIQLRLSYGQLWSIVDAVRNLILNWTLQLEKAGILGSDMTFTPEEKSEANSATQQFFIQNVGVLGNVKDQAVVTNNQTSNIEISKVQDFINEVQQLFEAMPKDLKKDIEPIVKDLQVEISTKKSQSRIKGLLNSAKSIAERATGSVIAQGIVSGIKTMM